jgi:DNA-binding transcriptional LysR family regulator
MAGNTMNLRHIEVFHAVYVNGSVSAAAKALNVSQPSVSKVLKHAEGRLEFPLFRRIGGRLIPSDEGHILFKEVDDLYRRIGAVNMTAKNLRGSGEGHIRLAVPPALGLSLAPAAIARFHGRNASVTFDVQTRHHDDILRSLAQRESDLAVGYDVPQHPRLASVAIGTGELVVLYRRKDLKTPGARLDLSVLSGLEFIGLSGSGPLGDLFTRAVEQSGVKLKTVATVHTYYVAAALVRFGIGVAVVDEFTARAALTPELAFRPFDPPIPFGLHCMYLVDHPPSGLVKKFLHTFRKVVAEGRP